MVTFIGIFIAQNLDTDRPVGYAHFAYYVYDIIKRMHNRP